MITVSIQIMQDKSNYFINYSRIRKQHHKMIDTKAHFNSDDRMPLIKKNTIIGTGAKIIGNIVIGGNCIIGANAVVTKSIPDNSIVVGANITRPREIDKQESKNL